MNIEQVTAMLAEKHRIALGLARRDYETARLQLYTNQNDYIGLVNKHPSITSFNKLMERLLKPLSKACCAKLHLNFNVYQGSYGCHPTPPQDDFREGVIYQTVNYQVNIARNGCGQDDGGEIKFTKQLTIKLAGDMKTLVRKWAGDHKVCTDLCSRAQRLYEMNIGNEAQMLMLKLTEPDSYLKLEVAIAEILK